MRRKEKLDSFLSGNGCYIGRYLIKLTDKVIKIQSIRNL